MMKNLKLISCLAFSLMCSSLAAGQNVNGNVMSVQKQLKEKRLLQEDIAKLRLLKRLLAMRESREKLALKEAFCDALDDGNLEKVELLLKSGIKVNEPIDYNHEDGIIKVSPLMHAAVSYTDLEMVQLLLRYGAITNFSNGSLIYQMLLIFNKDGIFWSNSNNVAGGEDSESIRSRYLIVLQYLFSYCEFDRSKNEDSKKCATIWAQISEEIEQGNVFGEKSLQIISEITVDFFDS